MADTDTQVPETVVQQPLENINSVPKPDTAQNAAEVEAARKEAEQARMRANQLENELKKFQDQKAEAESKRLQEKEEYKTLWEQANSQLQELTSAQERQVFQQEVTKKESELISQYSEEVLDIAKTADLKLNSVDEDAVAEFKTKLDKIQSKIGSTAKIRPENRQQNTNPESLNRDQAIERLRQGDRTAATDAVETLGFIQAYNKQFER
jgi:Asp-tRNA(Asn)/Glu-tRNA(Gln) amidotransferase C subunit